MNIEYDKVPVNKIITNNTNSIIKLDLTNICEQSYVLIEPGKQIDITAKTSYALAILNRRVYDLGLLIKDSENQDDNKPEPEPEQKEMEMVLHIQYNNCKLGDIGTYRNNEIGTMTILNVGNENTYSQILLLKADKTTWIPCGEFGLKDKQVNGTTLTYTIEVAQTLTKAMDYQLKFEFYYGPDLALSKEYTITVLPKE